MYSRPQQENDQSRHLNDKGQDVGKEEPLLILGTFLETGCFGTDQNYNSYTLVGRDGAGSGQEGSSPEVILKLPYVFLTKYQPTMILISWYRRYRKADG